LPSWPVVGSKLSTALAVVIPVTLLLVNARTEHEATHRGREKKQTPTPGAAPRLRPPRRRSERKRPGQLYLSPAISTRHARTTSAIPIGTNSQLAPPRHISRLALASDCPSRDKLFHEHAAGRIGRLSEDPAHDPWRREPRRCNSPGRAQNRGWPAKWTCPPREHQARLRPQGQRIQGKVPS